MPSNAPYCYTNSKGELDGYIPHVVEAIMKDAGLPYKIVPNTMETMYHYNSINERNEYLKIDDLYMTGVISNAKRATFYYSIPYLTIEFYILSQKGGSYCGISDFEGKSLGVTKNHASEARMLVSKDDRGGTLISDTIVTFPKLSDGLKAIAKGEVDYIMVSEQCLTTKKELIKELDLVVNHSNFPPLDIAITSKDQHLIAKINKSIYKLKEAGTFDKLFSKYILSDTRSEFEKNLYWIIAVACAIIILLLVIVFICRYIIVNKVKMINIINRKLNYAIEASDVYIWEYTYGTNAIHAIIGDQEKVGIDFSQPDKQLENVHPEDREIMRNAMADLHSSKRLKVDIIVRIKKTNGPYRWMRNIINKIPNKSGYQLIGSCQNVNEKIRMQKKIEDDNKSLRFIADNAPIAIFIKEPSTQNILYHNQASLDVFDVQDTEQTNNFWNYTETPGTLETIKASDNKVLETGSGTTLTLQVTLKSGRQKFLYVNKNLITYDNKQCIIEMVFDVGEQLRGETNSQLLDLSKPLIKAYTWSYDGLADTYIYGSGYDTEDHRIARNLDNASKAGILTHPDDKEYLIQEFRRLIENGSGDSHIKYRAYVEKDNEYEWWESYMKAETKTLNGKSFTILYGFDMNIDKQTRNEIELKEAKDKAEESERMKSMFLANMSHEIRTPLNAIVGFSSLMPDADKEEQVEYMNLITMNNEILLNLINDILDLSKIDAGLSFNIETINFPSFFNDLTTSLIYKQKNPNVEFIVDSPYDSIMCNIDKQRVGQIITNFTTNAIKHTSLGHIKVGYTYTEDGVLELYVEDTGRGVPQDKQHLLFQRFQKLDTITRGTGLGLSIVAAIVQKMEGEYGFESQEGVGSRFWVRIKPDVTNIGEMKQSNESISYKVIDKSASTAEGNKLNILIAEDVQSNYILIERMLKAYNLTHVENGVDAVKYVKQNRYDIVLMDMAMPVMGGLEATKEIRKFNKNIPIIAVTAFAFDADKAKALDAGCNGFVSKPLNKEELIKAIEKETEALSGGGGKYLYISNLPNFHDIRK